MSSADVKDAIHLTYKWARRLAILLVGGTVLLFGLALTVLPGPALVVIPVGLGILSLEFAWARHWLRKVREAANGAINGITGLTGNSSVERGRDPRDS